MKTEIDPLKRVRKWRLFLADAATLTLFSIAHGFVIEIIIVGMSFHQFVAIRGMGIAVDLLWGRPSGLFTDWMRRKFQVGQETSRFKKYTLQYVSDTIAFSLSQLPIYVIVLLVAKATWPQIFWACLTLTATVAPVGGPYGFFLNFVRRSFGVGIQPKPNPERSS